MCYGDPSATEVPPCCETATKKLTFSTTSVLLLLNMPLSLSRATIFRRQKNPRRVYRPKIAGILFVCNEPEGKYYTVPVSILQRSAAMFTSTTAIWWIGQAFTIKHTIKLKLSCTLMFLILILVDSLQWMKYHLYLSPWPPAFVSAYSLPSLIYKQFSRRSKNAWQGRRCSIRCCSLQTVECLVTCIEMRRQHQYFKK